MILENLDKREARWGFCLALYHGGEVGVREAKFQEIAGALKLNLSTAEVREILRYLEEAGYCQITQVPEALGGSLYAKRTNLCVDLCEYTTVDAPLSIARPAYKYW